MQKESQRTLDIILEVILMAIKINDVNVYAQWYGAVDKTLRVLAHAVRNVRDPDNASLMWDVAEW